MTEHQTNINNKRPYEVSLLEVATILTRRRWFIAKIAISFALLAIIYSLTASPVYCSKMTLMTMGGKVDNNVSAIFAAIGGKGLNTAQDTVVGIIKSPAVLDRVIDSKQLLTCEEEICGLRKLLHAGKAKTPEKPRSREKVRIALGGRMNVAADEKTGLISLSVGACTPERSVEMTQAVFDATQYVMQTLATSPSAQTRLVLETQLKIAAEELAKAEKEVAKYNYKQANEGKTPTDMTALMTLQSKMLSKEMELHAAKSFGTAQNPQVKKLQAEYDAMRREFAQYGDTENPASADQKEPTVAGRKTINDTFEYTEKLRDYRLKETTYNMLLARFENAKVTEEDRPLVIQAVGKPTIPEKRSKPQRKKIVVLATLLGIFVGTLLSFARHFYEIGKHDKETAEQMEYIGSSFRQDITQIKNRISKKH